MKKEMLINVLQPEECRIAILEDSILEELYVERTSHESYVGNIYKGRIVNIEPSIQAAFVDFGVGRNGFLHVSDVEPAYYRNLEGGRADDRGRPRDDRGRGRRGPGDGGPGAGRSPAPAAGRGDLVDEGETGSGRPRRGRPRRGRRPVEEEAPGDEIREAPSPGPDLENLRAGDEGPEGEFGRGLDDDPGPPTTYMDSAERRTEEENGADEGPHLSDQDLFFPRADDGPSSQGGQVPVTAPSAETEPELPTVLVHEADRHFPEEETDEDPERTSRPSRERGGRGRGDRPDRRGGRPRGGRDGLFARPKPLIQDIFRRGQEVLVQVIKEGIGTKGPTLSTYISIAGRYLVLMPGLNRIGVSRKIVDDEQRRRLREVLGELHPPKGLGFIIRTAGIDRNKKELQRDLAYLSRLWQVVVRRIRKLKAPAEIYQESDMITRTIRDTFTSEIDTIWVDESAAFEHAQEFMQIVMPRYAGRIRLYQAPEPMFHKYGIEGEIARIQQRRVPLPNGGSIVIEQTEALVAIDVNSGNFRADNNAEETAYQMNLLAAKEIARQLRLRDMGGVIVNDFIDMRDDKHRRSVEKALRDAVKRDRARTKILKISAFGIIEMTRQRIRPSLKRSVYQDCPHCLGTGQVKTCESMSIEVMRLLQLAAHRPEVARVQARVAEEVAAYLQNRKRREISRLEEAGGILVLVSGTAGLPPETLDLTCHDNNNNELKLLPTEEPRGRRR